MADIVKKQEASLDVLGIDEEFVSGMETMTPNKIAKIAEGMVEIDRANKSLGRRNTQTTNQLMTLTMLTDSPYRRLRQCLAQIEKKRLALESNHFGYLKTQVEIKEWLEEDTEMSRLQASQAQHNWERHKMYVEGSLKELAVFQQAYEEIKRNNNIPDNWDEEDAELDEIRHHIRQVFRQAHRDMILTGTITQGNAEYFEQYGIHLQTARNMIAKYIAGCEKLIEEGKMPNIDHLYEFLDNAVEIFGNEYHRVLKHIGLDGLIKQEFLYKSTKDLS